MTKKTSALSVLAACGTALGLAASASAAPFVINISGATLFDDFFTAPAQTNDFFDVDNDNSCAACPDNDAEQLAFPVTTSGFGSSYWVVQYRGVGSGNGLAELVDFNTNFGYLAPGVGVATQDDLDADDVDDAYANTARFIDSGNVDDSTEPPTPIPFDFPIFNNNHPGGVPVLSETDGTYEATTYVAPPGQATGGVQIDLAVLDVPVSWFVTVAGPGDPDGNPLDPGYGNNEVVSLNPDGTIAGQSNKLKSLGSLNQNFVTPNTSTVYDTPVATVPIAALTNLGTGYQTATMSDLRHMAGAGRLPTGENLVQVTRDSGSGTRNGYQNSIGQDPSFGVGENVGIRNNDGATFDRVGATYLPSNKGGSSRMEDTTQNTRLAWGYTGAERGAGDWLVGGLLEMLAVENDLTGTGAEIPVRPTIDAILDNDVDTGWIIGGPETFATVGDPLASTAAFGGDDNGNPKMANENGAAYLNNITKSITAIVSDPTGDDTFFTPGELLATQFILIAATDLAPNPIDPIDLIPNPVFNQNVQNFIRNNNITFTAANGYDTFGTFTDNGPVPIRISGTVYSDSVANGANYEQQDGGVLNYGDPLNDRNRVSGDFNGDALRNADDAEEMMRAFWDRDGGPAWDAPDGNATLNNDSGDNACIEILGDFTNDGNFDEDDIRYWADGLAIQTGARSAGQLDRHAGFAAVDNEWFDLTGDNNFFNTMLRAGVTYEPGDSAADVAGNATTPNYNPIGADQMVNAADIDYVYANFGDWANLNDAISMDLSADVDGDLVVDQDDVTKIVVDVLETVYGDVDLDGDADNDDRLVAEGNLGNPGGWAMGDMNGDGVVTEIDLLIIDNASLPNPCSADGDLDGDVDLDDFSVLAVQFGSAGPEADFDGNGIVDLDDFSILAVDFGCLPF